MLCPKCSASDWCEIASHDPWSGRAVVACNLCGEYVEDGFAEREKVRSIIADALSPHTVPGDQGGTLALASRVMEALENAGLKVAQIGSRRL
ncbi:hypothetical protein [Bradyrhizobium sp. Tv2a-2]|uniref:hypothetical protein n=1 Tax=Bradyrhizobium sp. Tv2a-2 TaxID=113395 RepID=UPI00041396D1|nr:hypothetical protein [Bradyrhizobium sp. Tv2a-2]